MVREGLPFVIGPVLLAIVLAYFHIWIAAALFIAVALFIAYFFRDPDRTAPEGDDLVVSAADGRVTRVEDVEGHKFVSVFLSPLDVHVNRAPIGGMIENISYTEGKKIPATSARASLVNEQNSLTIKGEKMTVVCTQIAGILARRIVCWSKAGEQLQKGQRFGMIKFGSRTDLLLPKEVEIFVAVGDRVVGGETVIGRLGQNGI